MSDPHPPQLEYAVPTPAALSGGRMVVQAILGCAITCGTLMGSAFALILFGYANMGGVVPVLIGCAILLAMAIGIALRARRNPLRRGWAMGIWIGIGLACLLEGLCFGGVLFR